MANAADTQISNDEAVCCAENGSKVDIGMFITTKMNSRAM
jgi:hypothetical protein